MNDPRNNRSEKISVFRSPEAEAEYAAAYDAVLKAWPVPYEEGYIPTRFGDTHVIASGSPEAPALILLHSSGSSAVQWIRNIGPLSQQFRTYAVDVIGEEGKSIVTHPIRDHCRENFAAWMEEVFDGLHIDSAFMVGNSLGGLLTFNTALYLPERVKKMVLISPAATFVQMWPFYWHLLIPRGIYLMTPRWISDRLKLVRLAHRAFGWIWQDFPEEECSARLRTIRNISGYPRNRIFPPVYREADLRKVQTPTLLLIGDHEVIYKPETAIRRATQFVPGLKAEVVPNANHNAQVTAPEIVNDKILAFFTA
jgi:pimeloyl-ACP methyl ester carboxylesterase